MVHNLLNYSVCRPAAYTRKEICNMPASQFAFDVARKLLLAVLLIAPAGIASKTDKDHNDAFSAGPADESRIAQKVRHELLMLPYYGVFDDLAFRVEGSTVTLLGEVTRPTLKSDAENVIKRVEGVTKVVNQIEVLPLSPMDDQVRRAEYRAIYGDPVLSTRYGYQALPSIHILVKNGHVRLEGIVANQGDKNLIGIRANGVPNVFSVENALQVEGK
jgi:hyperosmotically inducible periplasmic protein